MSGHRLLVVDDDPDVVEVVEAAFDDSDVAVESAASGEAALGRLSGNLPDLILLDVRLPRMDGLELYRILKERGVDVPVVLISSHTTMDLAIDAMKEGAFDYLDKPLRVGTLVPVVEGVLKRRAEAGDGQVLRSTDDDGSQPRLVGKSQVMVEVFKTIGRVARTNATVLVTGESGTGKELVARILHQKSVRSEEPFQAVNCAAIPANLLESELFGHEEGAFTGATQRKLGKFELAGEGTLLLDEVAELPTGLQPKLLRALEEREVSRLGGGGSVPLKARVVAATNRDLEETVDRGILREDLFYRLAVVRIDLPPLRDRRGDIPPLVDHFVERLGPELGRRVDSVAPATYELLKGYHWPGNVRELRNVVARALVHGQGPTLRPEDVPEPGVSPGREGAGHELGGLARGGASLEDVERLYLTRVLEETGGNQTRAAEILGIHRSTLKRKIDSFGIELPS